MSKHHVPWDILIDTAKEAVDAATETLAAAQRRLIEAQKQHETLLGYRAEYLDKLAQSRESGLSIGALANQHRFIDKLDQAVAQQSEAIAQFEKGVAHAQRAWQESQRKLKSFDTLAERQNQRIQQQHSKQEQRAADEHATQQFVTRNRTPS